MVIRAPQNDQLSQKLKSKKCYQKVSVMGKEINSHCGRNRIVDIHRKYLTGFPKKIMEGNK